jgi:DNA-binding SARP family transcriptional activator
MRHARQRRNRFAIGPLPVHLEFRILGPLEAVGPDGPVRLGGPRQRAVLAILLLSANRVVSIDRLADELYAGDPPATAVTQVHRQISDLRKLLGTAIETRAPGYLVRTQELDLRRFEQLTEEAASALARGTHEQAAARLREALALWRGPPLADLAYEPFAAAPIARLEELRLTTVEQRIEAELALGEHRGVVAELEALVDEHPTHERFRAQLMIALYRSGRQEDALAAYRALRRTLVETFGIEPTPELAQLEQAVLDHDPSLDGPRPQAASQGGRTVLVSAGSPATLEALAQLASPLAAELLLIQVVGEESELAESSARLAELRSTLASGARAAAILSDAWGGELAQLATAYDVGLVVVDMQPGATLPAEVATLLEQSPADVALLASRGAPLGGGDVLVGFGGSDHDWAAAELGAWLAASTRKPLKLVALRRPKSASTTRLLAAAAIAIQGAVGIDAQPLLVDPGADGLLAAARGGHALVLGLSPAWRRRGLGEVRSALAQAAETPLLLVHRGPRPGGLAPPGAKTRFTWSLG